MKSPPAALALALVFAFFAVPFAFPQSGNPKFDEIKAKHDRGDPITPEERSYAQGVMARGNAPQGAGLHPPRESTGFVPLSDFVSGNYLGEQGGLYPGGLATPPPAHAAAGLRLARALVPLDADGRPAADGKIVLLTCGMSNTTQESQAFKKLAAADPALNPRLVIVDGAQGGQTAAITAQPDANYWNVDMARLRAAGVAAEQVQAVWVKGANARPTRPFPAEAKKLQADLAATLRNLHDKFPNLTIAYLSSRIFGGYATTPLNPEPHAYETGFAVKWLVADQIAGAPELNFDPAKGAVRAPWIAWGAYLWTDGIKGRKDGLVWQREDCGPDGTHPSETGRMKVGELLLKFFKGDPTAQPWFLKKAP